MAGHHLASATVRCAVYEGYKVEVTVRAFVHSCLSHGDRTRNKQISDSLGQTPWGSDVECVNQRGDGWTVWFDHVPDGQRSAS